MSGVLHIVVAGIVMSITNKEDVNNKKEIKKNIYECLDEYKKYIDLDIKFPHFKIIIDKELPKDVPGQKGKINAQTIWHHGKFTLKVPDKILNKCYKPILFHEFTHIYDFSKWVKKYGAQKIAVKGFSEYHAYQIQKLKCYGIEFGNLGKITEYPFCILYDLTNIQRNLLNKLNDLSDDIKQNLSRIDFPNCCDDLDFLLDMLFKYWGYRSIYKLCGGDQNLHIVEVASEKIEKVFKDKDFNQIKAWDDTLYGILESDTIVKLIDDYAKTRNLVVKRFHLKKKSKNIGEV